MEIQAFAQAARIRVLGEGPQFRISAKRLPWGGDAFLFHAGSAKRCVQARTAQQQAITRHAPS